MLAFGPKFAALAKLTILFAQKAGAQTQPAKEGTQSNLEVKPSQEISPGRTAEDLLNERDTLRQQETDLSNQIG